MRCDRRTFLEHASRVTYAIFAARPVFARGLWGTSVAHAQAQAADTSARAQRGATLIARMNSLNPPASFNRSGDKLTVRSRPKTDFWRKTFTGYTADNGHFFFLPVEGDFTFQARVNGQYASQFDQAGVMVRLDENNWMKCGTEFFDGQRHASVVFTRDFSDWSTMPDLSSSAPVWWRVVRKRDSIDTSCSLDGQKFTSIRQGYFPPRVKVSVGVMCAAPMGPGFEAVFDELALVIG